MDKAVKIINKNNEELTICSDDGSLFLSFGSIDSKFLNSVKMDKSTMIELLKIYKTTLNAYLYELENNK